jgi:NAD+ diphosphatase
MAEHIEMNFCRRCGAELSHATGHAYECPNGHTLFINQPTCVGVFFLTDDGHLLLSRRGIQPYKGMLDTFGGFVDSTDASVEEAAIRELREEASLEPEDYEPFHYLTSRSAPYPYEGETGMVMSILYWTRLTTQKALRASDDVADVVKVPLHELDLALTSTDDIRDGILTLRELFPDREQDA